MDVDVAYSYVNISIEEVMEFRAEEEPVKKNTFADRLKNTIKSTASGFLMFLEVLLFLFIRLFPYLVIVGIIVFFALRKTMKKRREEKERMAQQQGAMNNGVQNANNATIYGTMQQPSQNASQNVSQNPTQNETTQQAQHSDHQQ